MVASGAATNVQLTADPGTVVPGAGVDLFSQDTAAGFQTDGTAYTPEECAYVSEGIRYIRKGERLSADLNGTLTTFECLLICVALKPV